MLDNQRGGPESAKALFSNKKNNQGLNSRLTFSVRMPRVLSSVLAERSLAARDKRSV